MTTDEQRTIQQNKAMHKYFELVAQALNDSGQDMSLVLIGDEEKIRKKISEIIYNEADCESVNIITDKIMHIIYYCIARMDLPWTKESVKEKLWRPIQISMWNKESTIELDTANPNEVYLVLSRYLSEKHGINIEWPSYQ